MSSTSHLEDPICIFVHPSSLTFYADDPTTHKQNITISNPYGFHVKFRVLSSDHKKYVISNSQGLIRSLNVVDLTVRHRAITPSNIGITDNIRVQCISTVTLRSIGIKEIPVTLLASKPESTPGSIVSASPNTEGLEQPRVEPDLSGYLREDSVRRQYANERLPCIIFNIVAMTICALILYLPNENDTQHLPLYLQVNITVKLVAAFILGVMFTLFIRT